MNKFILEKIFGWKIIGDTDPYRRNSITLIVPHTSYWDGFLGYFAMKSLRIHYTTMAASWLFFWPFSIVMKKALNAFPATRGVILKARTLWENENDLTLILCPEGHLRAVKEWPKGFLKMANLGKVPVNVVAFNYKEKVIYLLGELDISGNPMKNLREMIKDKVYPKYPEKYISC